MARVNFRRQQIVYAVALFLGVLACVATGLIGRFKDIDFTGDLYSQYYQLTSIATPLLEMNVAFVIFLSLLTFTDLFRSKATPVWFEMVWTFIFGILEIICIVLLSQNQPSAHCTPSSTSSLTRRDGPTDTVIGQAASASSAQSASEAAKEVCSNWAVMFVFFTMVALILFLQFGWLALLTLRHRLSQPNFIWFSETPSPGTWHLAPASQPSEVPAPDDTSFTSSSLSSMDVKNAGVFVSAPTPIQVRVDRSSPQQRVDFYGIHV